MIILLPRAMSVLDFDHNPTDLILSQLKEHNSISRDEDPDLPHSYLQVKYMEKHILKLDPQQAQMYEKSVEQENAQQYFEESERDELRCHQYQSQLMKRFFRIRHKTPHKRHRLSQETQPLEMIKNYSRTEGLRRPGSLLASVNSIMEEGELEGSRVSPKMMSRYNDSVKDLMASAEKLIKKRQHPKLRGGTMIEQQKMWEKVLRKEKDDILKLLKNRNYSKQQPKSVQEIPNKEKYSMGYLNYLRLKTKAGLDKELYQRRVRKVETKVENFQQFIIRQGELRPEQTAKLHGIYTKIREDLRKNRHTPSHMAV